VGLFEILKNKWAKPALGNIKLSNNLSPLHQDIYFCAKVIWMK